MYVKITNNFSSSCLLAFKSQVSKLAIWQIPLTLKFHQEHFKHTDAGIQYSALSSHLLLLNMKYILRS